ncbi:MAG: hypothetical protein WBL29_02365 [Burkholderiales bacterium]
MSFSRHSFLSFSPAGFHRIAYLDWGKRAAAQVVVCVHGLSRNSRDFDWLSRDIALQMQAMRPDVEVLELPGVGHAPALMSYDQIAAVRAFLLR